MLPVYVSLTSGDPSPEIVKAADGAGGLPVLRGTFEAFAAVARLAWWEGRRARRLADGPVRPEWPALAVDVPRYGRDPDTLGIPTSDLQAEALAPASEPVDGAERAALAVPERESLELLRAAGIAVVAAVPAATADSAATAAAGLGWPVVVKLDALDVAHKSDIGGVVVGILDEAGVRAAFESVTAAGRQAGASVRGVLVEAQAPDGVELVIGARRDPHYGALVVVGLGGTLAEVLDDVADPAGAGDPPTRPGRCSRTCAVAPSWVAFAVARRQTSRRSQRLIRGLGQSLIDHPEWLEVEGNPVVAGASGALAVDALVVLRDLAAGGPPR